MKYKKQIATGALALSLLIGGSTVFAATPQDLGVKNVNPTYQKSNKNSKKVKSNMGRNIVGTISAVTSTGFTVDVKNLKTKVTTSMEVTNNASTVFTKDGLAATFGSLTVGQKVIVLGTLDKTTNVVTAQKVKIITKAVTPMPKKGSKKMTGKIVTTSSNTSSTGSN